VSLEGKEWKKRNDQVEEIEVNGRGGFWRLTFLPNTKLSSFSGTQKLY